jgi:hypothetical protein
MEEKKYQIFVSSTYKDLIDAREKVFETILKLYCIFHGKVASDSTAWWPPIPQHDGQ